MYPKDFLDKVIQGDCIEVLKRIPDNSIDTIITDPPYGLEFMGKEWDRLWDKRANTDYRRKGFGKGVLSAPVYMAGAQAQEFHFKWASEVLRVAKPGAILLAFGGSRTWHRLACGLEDAGWIIKDTLMWIYGSGFPKSLNIGKFIDKLLGNEREIVGTGKPNVSGEGENNSWNIGYKMNYVITRGHNEWEGYGTSLKPAYEPIIMAMKPLDRTYAENALKWGVAGLNIDEARIEIESGDRKVDGFGNAKSGYQKGIGNSGDPDYKTEWKEDTQGRFPSNLLIDEVSAKILDNQRDNASRFFYVAKADTSERDAGLEGLEQQDVKVTNYYGLPRDDGSIREIPQRRNNHPTVKPLKLMDYLVKLTRMPNTEQVYLDPFAGSGSTLIAVMNNERHFIGIEKEVDYVKIAEARLKHWSKAKSVKLFSEEV